jgi:magnesium-transporting ATPase (P-type)
VFAEVAQLGSARRRGPVLALRAIVSNPFALGGAGVSIALQLLVYTVGPLADLLHVTALDAREWAIVCGLAVTPAVAVQSGKLWRARREAGPPPPPVRA